MGNTLHCIVVAYLLSSWAMITGYRLEQPFVSELWAQAGYAYEATDNPDYLYKHLRGVADVVADKPREVDPGVHEVDLGENVT
eukprot:6948300-Karenia_brevis.AAC.1